MIKVFFILLDIINKNLLPNSLILLNENILEMIIMESYYYIIQVLIINCRLLLFQKLIKFSTILKGYKFNNQKCYYSDSFIKLFTKIIEPEHFSELLLYQMHPTTLSHAVTNVYILLNLFLTISY